MFHTDTNFRYEELLSSHEGLLKLLESHVKEIQNYSKENEQLREQIKLLELHLSEVEQNFRQMCDKYLALKKRRDLKVYFIFVFTDNNHFFLLDKQTKIRK